MNMLELTRQVKLIKSKSEFIEFIVNLVTYLEVHPDEHLVISVIPYLNAIAAWTKDMDGYYQNHGEKPPKEPTWRTIGEILVAALYYE